MCGKERGPRKRLEIELSIQELPVMKCLNVPPLPGLADFSGSKAASAEAVKQNSLSMVFKNFW